MSELHVIGRIRSINRVEKNNHGEQTVALPLTCVSLTFTCCCFISRTEIVLGAGREKFVHNIPKLLKKLSQIEISIDKNHKHSLWLSQGFRC